MRDWAIFSRILRPKGGNCLVVVVGKGANGERVGGGVDELQRKVHRFFGKEEEFFAKSGGVSSRTCAVFLRCSRRLGQNGRRYKKTPRILLNGGVCASSRLALFVRGLRVSVGSSEGSSRATHASVAAGWGMPRSMVPNSCSYLTTLSWRAKRRRFALWGREDLAGIYASLGQTGKSGDEVEYELLRAVVDDGQIAVSAVGDFGSELDLELLTLFFFVCHERVVCYVDE